MMGHIARDVSVAVLVAAGEGHAISLYAVLYLQTLFDSHRGGEGDGQVFLAALHRVLLAAVAVPQSTRL